jgi:hypothetical protein
LINHRGTLEPARDATSASLTFQGGLSFVYRPLIVDLAAAQHMPAIYQSTVFAKAGGLMTILLTNPPAPPFARVRQGMSSGLPISTPQTIINR